MKKIVYKLLKNRLLNRINIVILSVFYDKYYLSGKYFTELSNGFVWAWRGVFRSIINRRRGIRWPIGKGVRIPNGKNIIVDKDSINVFQNGGGYFQAYEGKIYIGSGCFVAQNVGIITQNHDPRNPSQYLPAKDVHIGNDCWIGMNAVILPGVSLGDHTTVGAGSVVTHSFDGNCIVGGNPARIIREL